MDAYPSYYVGHNLPLVALCGLGTPDPNAFDEIERQYALLQEGGVRITSELPDVTGPKAEGLLDCFQEFDARDAAWNNRPGRGKMGSIGFTYRTVGRSIMLPPQKADWPSNLEDSEFSNESRRPSVILHSPLSPLSPTSPTYPDGILTPLWFAKHQLLLPAVLVVFFNFMSDPNRVTLEDNKLRNEINTLKTKLTDSGYKTRLGVVLVSEADDVDTGYAERVANLRKTTGLDSKALFHLPGYTSISELRAFVGNLLAAVQPACMEYYRDLSKHARRKRSRGSTPTPTITPTTGTSQTLSSQGWTVRYETKLGYFAEFRQEMDTAGRSYEAAYEGLLDGEIFEALSDWSSRFNENRMLADALAIRIIRCLLWTGQTTSAVQSWTNHKNRIQDLVNEKGKGTDHYGWQAWEARWSSVMGEMLERVDLSVFKPPQELRSPSGSVPLVPLVLSPPEKSFGNDPRLAPWDFLHHSGYWYAQAAQHLRARRSLAKTIPPNDRTAPGQSPASAVPSHIDKYDTFLCPDPYEEGSFDHSTMLINTLTQAAGQFSAREGLRSTERAYLEIALEHVDAKRWKDAMEVLRPLWQTLSWRPSGWWDLVFQASLAMKQCAAELEDWETLLAAEWELLSNCLPPTQDSAYDFARCLDSFQPSPKPYAKLDFANLAPTFTAKFTFSKAKGNAGVPELAQLTLMSCSHKASSPITIASLELSFEGGLKEVEITHDKSSTATIEHSDLVHYFDIDPLTTSNNSELLPNSGKSATAMTADLIFKPGEGKILSLKLLPREAGELQASSVTLKIREATFDFDMRIPLRERASAPPWWIRKGDTLSRQKLDLDRYCALTVLPKPPKLRVSLPHFPRTFYVDEIAEIAVHLLNEEEDTADLKLSVSLSGTRDAVPMLHLDAGPEEGERTIAAESTSSVSDITIGKMSPQDKAQRSIFFRAIATHMDLYLVVRADYYLLSDPETPIQVHLKEKIHVTAPFEGAFEFVPGIRTDRWPSYFVIDNDPATSLKGLPQSWTVLSKATSFATETLGIHDIQLESTDVKFAAKCEIQAAEQQPAGVEVEPNQRIDRSFSVEAQKADLEDRRSGIANLQLKILWYRREAPSKQNTTTLLVPSLALTFGEPRVLCAAQNVHGSPHLVNVTYVLENPSAHLLNFSVTMETSDEFAFSGFKAKVLQLVPLSRAEIKYTLVPFRQQTWIHPYLRVTDTGFGQELKIHASKGCRNEKKAIAIWVEEGSESLVEA